MLRKKKDLYQRGITLVALVVTIVVLLILAGITITYVMGDNSIFQKAQKAKNETEQAIRQEQIDINQLLGKIEEFSGEASLRIIDLILGNEKYKENCEDAIAMNQSTIGELETDIAMLERIEELLSHSGDMHEVDFDAINNEISNLIQEINQVSNQSKFNEVKLLNQDITRKLYYRTDNDIEIEYYCTSSSALEIENVTTNDIENSLKKVTQAKEKLQSRIDYYKEVNNKINVEVSKLEKNISELQKHIKLDDFIGEIEKENGILEQDKIDEIDYAISNLQNTMNWVQVAEENLNEIHSNFSRMYELTIQATDLNVDEETRKAMQTEINNIANEIDNIVATTEYEGTKLLDGTLKNKVTQLSLDSNNKIEISMDNCDTHFIGENGGEIVKDISTQEKAVIAEKSIEIARSTIGMRRAYLGSKLNRTEYIMRYLVETKEVLESKIEQEENRNYRLALAGLNQIQDMLGRIRQLEILS